MKRHSFVVVAVVLMVLSGCASSGSNQFTNNTRTNTRIVVDQQYVNQVNADSQRIFANIIWINPPTRRVPVEGDTSD